MALTRERLEQLIARSTDIVVATDRKGVVDYYNDGASQVLGYRPDEILGHFVAKLYPSLDEARRVMAAMRRPQFGGVGTASHFRTTFLSKAGEEIPVAISGTILHDDQGRENGTIGFAKDLREILQKDQLATLGEVAIGLSHEINNPLAVILNQAELLESDVDRLAGDGDCSVETERIDAIRRETARIAEIVERVGEMAAGDKYETVEYIGPARMVDLRPHTPGVHKPDPRLADAHILIVDDDLGIRKSLAELLSREGCHVETAGDGVEALAILDQHSIDVVISDVVMPKMDGYELFMAIRERFPELPVLMMTAFHYDRDHIIKRSRVEGLEGVIFKKPVNPDRLREKLIETLAARRR